MTSHRRTRTNAPITLEPLEGRTLFAAAVHPVVVHAKAAHMQARTGQQVDLGTVPVTSQQPAAVATVNWGDGSTSSALLASATATDPDGVYGSHLYPRPGTYHVEVDVTDPTDAATDVQLRTAVVVAANHTGGRPVRATAGRAFAGTVALYQAPQALAAGHTVTSDGVDLTTLYIDWGDGSIPTAATVSARHAAAGLFAIVGRHTYAVAGQYAVTVSAEQELGEPNPAPGQVTAPIATVGTLVTGTATVRG